MRGRADPGTCQGFWRRQRFAGISGFDDESQRLNFHMVIMDQAIQEVYHIPKFSSANIKSLRFYFEENKRYQHLVSESLNKALATHSVWGPILSGLSPELREAQEKRSQELQRAAIFDNNWDAYIEDLIMQGRTYARLNVKYSDWYELVNLYKIAVLPHVKADFSGSFSKGLEFLEGLSILTDFAMYVIAEAYFQEKNSELEQKVKDRTYSLDLINKELESFSYSVSHDLRAPIRAISGYTKILEEDYSEKLDEEGIKVIRSIKNSARRMGELIDDLLALSRLGRKRVAMSDLNMNAMVRSVLEETIDSARLQRAELNIGDLAPAQGDASLVKQVWTNLISNAFKYSGGQPRIRISIGCYERDNELVYFIKDNGVGFDMAYYDVLFGVFQRLHSQEEFEGTGIGLAIVQKIVHRHMGKVWAEAKPNEGACFSFSLPKNAVNT
jgi:signal transduction histidine kinase